MSVNAASYADLLVMVAALKEENERLKKKIDDLCYVISEDDKLIASLRKERDEQSEIHAKKYREIVALNARVAELEGRNNLLDRRVAKLVEIIQECGCDDDIEEPSNEG